MYTPIRSFVALIVHLYAIFALAKPYQQLVHWVRVCEPFIVRKQGGVMSIEGRVLVKVM